jgi:hypothetical protein
MIGTGWWSTGVTARWAYSGGGQYGWAASLDYLDDGWCDDDPAAGRVSTQGRIGTRYAVKDITDCNTLTVVLDVLIADAERLGIEWRSPTLYYEADGENASYPPPERWDEALRAQAARLGWRTYGYEPGSAP